MSKNSELLAQASPRGFSLREMRKAASYSPVKIVKFSVPAGMGSGTVSETYHGGTETRRKNWVNG